jgi:hypothetical protein
MSIKTDLSHNDPKRLRTEFLHPLDDLLREYRTAGLWVDNQPDVGEATSVNLFPNHEETGEGNTAADLVVRFFLDGTASYAAGEFLGSDPRRCNWTDAGKVLVKGALGIARDEITRIERYVKPLAEDLEALLK